MAVSLSADALTLAEWYKLSRRPQVKTRVQPEERLTIDCADVVRHKMVESRESPPWCHVPNEGKRAVAYKVKMAAMGLTSGFPDLIFPAPGSLAIELKMPKGRQSDSQKLVQKWCDASGVQYELATDTEQFRGMYYDWLDKIRG